jgi:chromosome segregation ATPase
MTNQAAPSMAGRSIDSSSSYQAADDPAVSSGVPDSETPSRRTSSVYSPYETPSRASDGESLFPLSADSARSAGNAADGASPSQWSSAVGRATTGKSSRVIERIQAENDRLRRELKLEMLRREEEQKKSEVARGQNHNLQSANDNLVLVAELDKTSLARKERKIQQLKADIEEERARRLEAESQLKQAMREHETVQAELKSQVREQSEQAKRALGQYDVLSSSWKQMADDYKLKTEKLRNDLAHLHAESSEDRRKLNRMELIIEQQKQEMEKLAAAKDEIAREFEAFKLETAEATRGIRERAEQNEMANDAALEETTRLLEEMRHAIVIGRTSKAAN